MLSSLSRGIVLLGLVWGCLGGPVYAGTAKATHCTEAHAFGGEVAQLCGRTVVRATSVSAIDVVLAERAMLVAPASGRWRFNRSDSNIWLEGSGRYLGFVIESTAKNENAAVMGGRIGGARGWDFFHYTGLRRLPNGIELPPGPYRIVLAPSERELTLKLDLPELGGVAEYAASDPVTNRIFTGNLGGPLGGSAGLYSFGMDGPLLGRESLGVAAIWGTASRHVGTMAGTCFYGPGGEATQERHYLPGCPSRGPNLIESRQTIVSAPPEEDRLVAHMKLARGLRAGRWGIGAWMRAEEGLRDVKVALVWINLN